MERRTITYYGWPFNVKAESYMLYKEKRFGRPYVAVKAVDGHPFPVFDEQLPYGATKILRHDIYWSDAVYIPEHDWENGERIELPMKKYLVIVKEKCSKCHGTGFVLHPAWQAYWESDDAKTTEPSKWFEENGWGHLVKVEEGEIVLPPEEIICDGCNGQGVVESYIDLATALKEIGFSGGGK